MQLTAFTNYYLCRKKEWRRWWNQNLSDLVEGRCIHHFKTTDMVAIKASITYYGANLDHIWNAYAVTRKWS